MQWQNKDGRLIAEITFKDQTAQHSDAVGHHADMEIHYNRLRLSLYTHDANAITEKDHELAKKLQELK